MRLTKKATCLIAILFLFLSPQTFAKGEKESPEPDRSMEEASYLPLDPAVVTGTLDNGLTYYIRENKRPENRAVLRLVVNAGSVLEDESQRGLAHLLEHMAFNGTKNFSKQEIINFMETIGMQFGPEVNAHTSFDETVYKLVVPMENPDIVDKAFLILEDWARNLSLDPEEIDKERGVVIEEWRQGRGAEARMRDEYFPVLFKNSRYATRLPIGNDMNVIRTFSYDTLRRFYTDWYRPELMAIVAVGDFDGEAIEALIRKHFSGIPRKSNAPERVEYRIPNHKETYFSIVTDPEARYTTVEAIYKYDPPGVSRVRDYRRGIIENLYNMMFSRRLEELMQQAEPPFLGADSGNFRVVRTKYIYELIAAVNDGEAVAGLETLLTEAKRVEQHGFTKGELDRARKDLMAGVERAYAERDKTESVRFAEAYTVHFLNGEPAPGIAFEYELYKKYLEGITIAEVNRLGEAWISDENRMFLIKAPEKEEVTVPTREELEAMLERVKIKKVEPYIDATLDEPLMAETPVPGKIVSEKTIPELGVTEWTLSNGVTVVLKPTTFKNDQILFTAFSPGGSSLVPDTQYMSAQAASSIIELSGLGNFNMVQIQKKLAGKQITVRPYIDELTEGIYGSSRPSDIETAFQVMHMYFTRPRVDETAFKSFLERMRGYIRNRLAQPEAVFQDTLSMILSQNHFRRRPLSMETLSEIDMKTAFDIYKSRFADAGDFTFIFTGAFTLEDMKNLAATYLGSLEDVPGTETFRDPEINPPEGRIERSITKGVEPRSSVSMVWSGPAEWSIRNRYLVSSLESMLDIRLREAVREDAGGTYGVSVNGTMTRYPDQEYQLIISFSCDPERVEELSAIVISELKKIRETAPDELYLTKVKEIQRRSYEQQVKENGFWLQTLEDAYFNGYDPVQINNYPSLVNSLTAEDLRRTAAQYITLDDYIQLVLYPEAVKTE